MPLQRRHDVAEEDRGVEFETPQRLQGHLRRQVRRARQRLEVDLGAQRPVLGQVAPRLTHDPDRPVRRGWRRQAARKAPAARGATPGVPCVQPLRHSRRAKQR